jgi:hypothetical protein
MVPTIKYLVFSFSRPYQQVSWYHAKMTDSIRILITMATFLGKSTGTNYLIEMLDIQLRKERCSQNIQRTNVRSMTISLIKPKREKPFKKTNPKQRIYIYIYIYRERERERERERAFHVLFPFLILFSNIGHMNECTI